MIEAIVGGNQKWFEGLGGVDDTYYSGFMMTGDAAVEGRSKKEAKVRERGGRRRPANKSSGLE